LGVGGLGAEFAGAGGYAGEDGAGGLGPYSLSRAAYATALLDLAGSGDYLRWTVNITG
jgi:hypothetical protein